MNVALTLTGLFGFFWGGFVTPLSIRLAEAFGILDLPDRRKIHARPMPRGAGLTLWSGCLLWSLYFVSHLNAASVRLCATGATLVFFCGYMDDIKSLSPFVRLAVHMAAAALMVFPLGLPPIHAAICFVWVTGMTSAYNLIDGVNGLCISVFISSALALGLLSDPYFGAVGAGLALGVFCWNFPRASTFLGDGGSTLLGFLFASRFVASASGVLTRARPHELIFLLFLLGGVPVLDTLFAFSRRVARGKSPFYPDKGHLHHIIMERIGSSFAAVACLLTLHVALLVCGCAVYARLK
ncbi:MAG: undecaprenyl/decaprenyl-phosphate alpha-N-acetylglucosaminyl 1-phosphate transferase [Synergistaceae bacterium]|jgi:UDP-GlcNAc:undecaprenyl-phosphate GlcNAc-1-phosphate transferase|nr:undecaprenyl/decaprenyl-phosphate alpha-N-acetylglucosaminyl 1-phosphate transferase [Synergistaceae bacterium]